MFKYPCGLYPNTVCESMEHIIKREFVFGEKLDTLKELELEFF